MEHLITAVGLALLHFVWQGVLLGAGFFLLMRIMRHAPAQWRYATGVLTLLLMLAAPVVTALYLWLSANPGGATAISVAHGVYAAMTFSESGLLGAGAGTAWQWSSLLPFVVALWLAGVLVMSLRVVMDARDLSRLRRLADLDIPEAWRHYVERACLSLNVKASRFAVGLCAEVRTPILIGWLRPLILMPVALAGSMPRAQLEMILAHEIAHLARRDHLVNLLQVFIETVLFYHPLVRMVSHRVRIEREHCTDDLAVDFTGDRVTYARALTSVETYRGEIAVLSVGAAGGEFSRRIQRLFETRARRQRGAVGSILAAVLAVAGVAGSTFNVWAPEAEIEAERVTAVAQPTEPAALSDAARSVPGRPQPAGAGMPAAPAAVSLPPPQEDPLLRPVPVPGAADTVPEPATGRVAEAPPETVPSSPASSAPAEPDPAMAMAMAPVTQEEASAQERPAAVPANGLQLAMVTPPPRAAQPATPVLTGGKLVRVTEPRYPRNGFRRGVESVVRLEVTVDTDGTVADVKVLEYDRSEHLGFHLNARRAVQEWRYEPFRVDGQPVVRKIEQVVEFRLDNPGQGFAAVNECDAVTGSRMRHCR